MITLVFLVCNLVGSGCYSATSEMVYPTEQACKQEAVAIIERNRKLAEEGKVPHETALYLCVNWGQPA